MSGWTPGPWNVWCNESGYPYQIHAPNGSNGPGGIRDVTRWASISMPASSEGQANARLIAAAPEMASLLSRFNDGPDPDEYNQILSETDELLAKINVEEG